MNPLDVFALTSDHNTLNRIWNSLPTTQSLEQSPFDSTVTKTIQTISRFIRLETTAYVRKRNGRNIYQMPNTVSFYSILTDISKSNVHNTKLAKCRHKESLLEHLVYAMTWNIFLMRCGTTQEQVEYGLLGLFHDIGKKKASIRVSKMGMKPFLSFPYHGDLSASISMAYYTPAHSTIVPYHRWNAICQCIRVHMCGYHSAGKTLDDLAKWSALRLETPQTKEYLRILSVSDVFARVSDTVENFADYFATRDPFSDYLQHDISPPEILQYTPAQSKKLDGFIVFVRGVCNNEKQVVTQRLQDIFGKVVNVISRDRIITDFAVKHSNVDPNASFNEIYSAYSPDTATRTRNAKTVNYTMQREIADSLAKGFVTVVEDPGLCFPGANSLLPDIASSAFKIAIDVRSIAKTELSDKFSDLQKQLNSLNTQDYTMVPPNSEHAFVTMRSCMSAKTYRNGLNNASTAHFVYQVTQNEHYTFGLDHTIESIKKLFCLYINTQT